MESRSGLQSLRWELLPSILSLAGISDDEVSEKWKNDFLSMQILQDSWELISGFKRIR
jgi:hypothetical protein